jgi:hypothetical protein
MCLQRPAGNTTHGENSTFGTQLYFVLNQSLLTSMD